MKYISIDLETTGLVAGQDQILQIGAIIEDTTLKLSRELCPQIELYNWRESYTGNPFALALNANIFKKILELKKSNSPILISELHLINKFVDFIEQNFGKNKVVVAGKNVASFDIPFLKGIAGEVPLPFHHRVIDPGMLFVNFETDIVPPDLKLCKERANLIGDVTHNALDDAWDVIQLLRTKY